MGLHKSTGCKRKMFKFKIWEEPMLVVVVFPQAPFRVTNVPGQASAGIIQLHHGFPEDSLRWLGYSICIGELFDYSCSVELAGSYLGHVPCKFWKVCLGLKYLPQINYGGKLTCLGCSPRIGYHWFGVLVRWACSFCVSGSQHQWSVIWMLLWEVLVVEPCQMAL